MALIGQLPENSQANHIANQLLAQIMVAAPNYGEARAAERRADFLHRLKIALKELNVEKHRLCKILVPSIQRLQGNDRSD
jgi:hypothetical protein